MTDDKQIERAFGEVFNALDPKAQRKALRGAMGKEARRLAKDVKSAIRLSGLGGGTARDITKGVWQRVYPDRCGAGFMVSVKATRKKKGQHTNRYGKMKPVLMWAAEGTRSRRVGGRRLSGYSTSWTGRKNRRYSRVGHSTGRMRNYGFMDKAENANAASVETNLWAAFERNLNKAVDKMNKQQ